MGRGKTVAEAMKKIGVTEQTYYRWKKKFGGLRGVFGRDRVSKRRQSSVDHEEQQPGLVGPDAALTWRCRGAS